MTYARLEDSFRDHPRFLEMSCGAVGLWASALAYCNKHLTNGRIPAAALVKLAPIETPRQRVALVKELLDKGAFEQREPTAYQVHDYLDWNDSKEKILAKREADRARKEAAREAAMSAAPSARNPSGRPSGQPPSVRAESAAPSARTDEPSPRGRSRAPAGPGATDGRTDRLTDEQSVGQNPDRARAREGPRTPGPGPAPHAATAQEHEAPPNGKTTTVEAAKLAKALAEVGRPVPAEGSK